MVGSLNRTLRSDTLAADLASDRCGHCVKHHRRGRNAVARGLFFERHSDLLGNLAADLGYIHAGFQPFFPWDLRLFGLGFMALGSGVTSSEVHPFSSAYRFWSMNSGIPSASPIRS